MQKTASKRHRWYIAANLFFVFLLIGHLVWFTNNLRKVNTETQIHEFLVSTDGAKRKVRDYMETSSRTLRDWKKLIGLNDWTAEEIPRKLDDLISSADITAQVLLTDTLRGYSSAAPAGKPGEYGMEYSDTYFSIFQTLTRFRESGRPDDVIITSSFTNPINAEASIAFVTQIETRDESGAAASAFLLYVEPLRALQEVWTAFSEKGNAQMSMINTMGDDTYRASMLKNENFYEYIISYNDLTYPQVEALRDTIRTAEEPGWIEYLNSKGQETLYAYSTDSQWGWTLIASIEMKAPQGASVQWTILIVSGFTFGMLYLVNSAYFRSLNRQLRSSLTQLEAANSAKTRFLSSMSHDIRTPMNAILGMTAIAEKQLNDRERLEDCLHKIDLAGNHLLTLVNDILDISQIESGRLTFRPSVFSLEESAADLAALARGDEGSGSFFDPEYETMLELKAKGYVDLDVNNAIPDVYEGSILAFFEGDVPFLAFHSEGFSGMAKRESKSEHFSAQPFDYAFAVIPVSGEEAAISAGFLPGLALVEGSANQDWGAEFLRFLCQKSELDKMAAVKGVPAVTRDSAGDARSAQLDTVPAARRVNQDISSDHSWVDECMQRCLDGILRGTLEDVEAARAHYERSIRHET